MTQPQAYVFDLDGTLIDSLADIAESVNRMLDARGFPRSEVELFRQMVGDGWRNSWSVRCRRSIARTPR